MRDAVPGTGRTIPPTVAGATRQWVAATGEVPGPVSHPGRRRRPGPAPLPRVSRRRPGSPRHRCALWGTARPVRRRGRPRLRHTRGLCRDDPAQRRHDRRAEIGVLAAGNPAVAQHGHAVPPADHGLRPDELVFTTPAGLPWNSHNVRRRYWRPSVAAATACPHHASVPARHGTGDNAASVSSLACRCADRLRQKPRFRIYGTTTSPI